MLFTALNGVLFCKCEEGVHKSANLCYFLANLPLFSFKSEPTLLEKFVWYSVTARCCYKRYMLFLCQFIMFRFISCLCDNSTNIPTSDPNFVLVSTIRNSESPKSAVFSKSANPFSVSQKSAICVLFMSKSFDLQTYSPPFVRYNSFVICLLVRCRGYLR